METVIEERRQVVRRHRRRGAGISLVALVGSALVGCGGDSDTTSAPVATAASDATTESADAAAPTTQAGTVAATPADLGEQIGTIYQSVYDEVIATLSDRPEPAEATSRLTALKDQYIEQLVALGHEREALDASGRATVDAAINRALMSLPQTTLTEYQAAIDDYATDTELADLIRSFNIIGQYASFDLLREQAPDEAARLGIG